MPELGEMLEGRYLLQEKLGQGPVASTFKAQDQHTSQPVVLKHMHFQSLPDWKGFELFEREQKVLQALEHPQIPKLLDAFQTERAHWFVMRYISGPTLLDKIKSGWYPSEAEIKTLAKAVLNILRYLHDCNPPIVHRDIKPSNLIDHQGDVYLVDFGAVQDRLLPDGSSTIIGTTGYMAPEQFAGHATPSSDLYSLGATLVHILSGIFPGNLPQSYLKLDFKSYIQVSEPLEAWLDTLLEPMPEKRFKNASEALRQLDFPHVKPTLNVRSAPLNLSRLQQEQPAYSRLRIQQLQDYVQVDIPRLGLLKQELYPTLFLLIWTSIIGGWTFLSLRSGFSFFALFSVPFWGVSAWMAWSFVLLYWIDTTLYLTPETLTIERRLLGFSWLQRESVETLKGLEIDEYQQVNRKPYYALKWHRQGHYPYAFAKNLSLGELKWLKKALIQSVDSQVSSEHSQEIKRLSEGTHDIGETELDDMDLNP